MRGLMQNCQLTVDRYLDHAAKWHAKREIVTRTSSGDLRRTNYAEIRCRAKQVSNALISAGIKNGDRVATMAWNSDYHIEAWYGIVGIGAVCHTLNPRLFGEQLLYIINHAKDRLVFADPECAELLEELLPACPSIENVIFLCSAEDMPNVSFPAISYLDWIDGHGDVADWGAFDEQTACGLCYTSGTTGNPKGVLYSHRSNSLHTMTTMQVDGFGLCSRDTILMVPAMYHANGWGIIYSAPACGAKLVLPGRQLDAESLYELIEREGVTYAGAVPTLWQMILRQARDTGRGFSTLQRATIGGSAMSATLYDEFQKFDIEVSQGWGMTEAGPLAVFTSVTPEVAALSADRQSEQLRKAGRPLTGIEVKVIDDFGEPVPFDGKTPGYLKVRGPTIAGEYYGDDVPTPIDDEGYFDTGDIVTFDELGYMQITDRAKDLIKSGGEWISSIDIENVAVGHPKIEMASVIGVEHEHYKERPLIIIQLTKGESMTSAEVIEHLRPEMAKWWLPDAVEFIDELPLGATGKVDKKILRTTYAGYKLPA